MTDTDKLSAIERAAKAIRQQGGFSDDKYEHGWSKGYAQAAILAYLSAITEDEAALHAVAQEIWDGLSASGLAYEAEERRAKLSAKFALRTLLSRAKEQQR